MNFSGGGGGGMKSKYSSGAGGRRVAQGGRRSPSLPPARDGGRFADYIANGLFSESGFITNYHKQ